MNIQTYTRLLVVGGLISSLACARSTSEEDVSARRDTTSVADTATVMQQDTAGGQEQVPPGYGGMERDTTQFPQDTSMVGQDTSGYNQGAAQDTTGYGQDTTGYGQDTTGYGQDTSGYDQGVGQDTTNQYPGTDSLRIHTDSANVNPPSPSGQNDSASDSSSWSTGRDSTPR